MDSSTLDCFHQQLDINWFDFALVGSRVSNIVLPEFVVDGLTIFIDVLGTAGWRRRSRCAWSSLVGSRRYARTMP